MTDDITSEQIPDITRFVDVQAPPPDSEPTACLLFGTNQVPPVDIAAGLYHRGLAPLIIATGGVNRHNGIIEGQVFRELLLERGVPEDVIRVEDRSANTWQNVEFSLPFVREALAAGLRITAVSKWYHRRAIHVLKTVGGDVGPFYAIGWDPIYAGRPVTRQDWPEIPDGRRRVIREWREVSARVADGSFAALEQANGAWR
ncbi:YdcF family protein [Actinomadura opuntiae]|uniref:YdcF family protein n=1 Tax=Actinomadura sp. OS1-43 TaxID=604315 RepID=UPI00255AF9B6|nr:YdcF family protein [Actinomadura sp. OS1-43]MDL4812844.1 YdcF family protein [Actinomadura sp. OS1-43]